MGGREQAVRAVAVGPHGVGWQCAVRAGWRTPPALHEMAVDGLLGGQRILSALDGPGGPLGQPGLCGPPPLPPLVALSEGVCGDCGPGVEWVARSLVALGGLCWRSYISTEDRALFVARRGTLGVFSQINRQFEWVPAGPLPWDLWAYRFARSRLVVVASRGHGWMVRSL